MSLVQLDGLFRSQWALWGYSSQCPILVPLYLVLITIVILLVLPLAVFQEFSVFRTNSSWTSFWKDIRTRHMFSDSSVFPCSSGFFEARVWSCTFICSVLIEVFPLYLSNYLLNSCVDTERIDWGRPQSSETWEGDCSV